MSETWVAHDTPIRLEIVEGCEIEIRSREYKYPHTLEGLVVSDVYITVHLKKESNAAFEKRIK